MASITPSVSPSAGRDWSPNGAIAPAPSGGLSGSDLTGSDRDAAVALTDLFKSFGLGSLAPQIVDYIKQGYSADTITIMLQQSSEYKQRFKANEVRKSKGLPVLSPAEYVATEDAYRQTLRKWGVPAGFYDSTNDFQSFLENDLSPVELDQRAQEASDFMNQADPTQMAYYRQYYTQGDLVAFALDPNRAAPLVGKAFAASKIGGNAQSQGINIDQSQAESLASSGVTADQAQAGFGQIAQMQPGLNMLSSIYGDQKLTTQDLIDATFKDNADSTKRIKRLASKERAQFGGSTAANAGTLASENNF